jgi:type II secretory pathway pseudopilin PulG
MHRKDLQNQGFSYVEILVAIALISVCLVPALQALQSGLQNSAVHESRTLDHYALQGKLEELLAEPYVSLDAAATAAGGATNSTSYSAPPLFVYIVRYDLDDADGDGNPLTDGEDGLLWVKVELDGTTLALETLTSR